MAPTAQTSLAVSTNWRGGKSRHKINFLSRTKLRRFQLPRMLRPLKKTEILIKIIIIIIQRQIKQSKKEDRDSSRWTLRIWCPKATNGTRIWTQPRPRISSKSSCLVKLGRITIITQSLAAGTTLRSNSKERRRWISRRSTIKATQATKSHRCS